MNTLSNGAIAVGAPGSLMRFQAAYDQGDTWVWQITFSPRMRDAIIMETFKSRRNQDETVKCFYLDDCRRQFEGRSFDSGDSMAKLQQLYFHAKEMWLQ